VTGKVNTEARNAASSVSAFFRGAGYAMYNNDTLPNCNYDATDCYAVKVMPTVSAISHSQGYAEGGQNLTITGTSLDGQVSVTVDSLPCDIKKVSSGEVICTTRSKTIDPSAQLPDSYIGQQGLMRYTWNNTNSRPHWDWRGKIAAEAPVK
jgi:hypothetical protein